MLRIRVEIVPVGVEANATEIGEVIIINTGKGDTSHGAYTYSIKESNPGVQQRCGEIHSFDRCKGAMALLHEVLAHSYGNIPSEPSVDVAYGEDLLP